MRRGGRSQVSRPRLVRAFAAPAVSGTLAATLPPVAGSAVTLTYSGDSIPSEAPAWVNSGNLITEFGFDVAAGSPPTSPWTSNAKWQLAVPTTGYYTHRTQVDDGTAPHSPGEFSRIWYEAGMTADASGIPGLVYYAGATYAKVFQTIWFRYNTTFQWHAYGASKICYAPANYTDTLANWAILAMDDRGGGNAFSIGIVDNVLGQSGSDTLSALHRTTVVTVQRGDWVRLSIESIGSTDGAYNGSVNLWVNGVSQGEGAIAIRHSNAAGLANINGFHLGGYWGGGGGVPKAADDYLDLDHAVMYGGS